MTSPGWGARCASAAARTTRLVSCPSCSYAVSGSPGTSDLALAGPGVRRTRRRRDAAEAWDGRPTMRPRRRAGLRRGAEVTEHREAAAGIPLLDEQGRDAGGGVVARRQHDEPGPWSEVTAKPVDVTPDEGHDVGILCGPAHPGPGQRDRRHSRMDPHRVGTQLAHECRADARDERVAAREHDDATGADVVEDALAGPGSSGDGHGTRRRPGRRLEHGEMTRAADDDLGLVDEPAAIGPEGAPARTHPRRPPRSQRRP